MSDDEKIEMFKKQYSAVYLESISEEKKRELRPTLNPVLGRLMDNLERPKTYMVDFIEGPVSLYKYQFDFKGKPTKTFYLFGEFHKDTRGDCQPYSKHISIDFMEYIKRLSNETPSFTDLYVELPMLRKSKPADKTNLHHYDRHGRHTTTTIYKVLRKMATDQSIDFYDEFNIERIQNEDSTLTSHIVESISKDFNRCIQPSTRNDVSCQLMRIHNIDIRSSFLTEEITDDLYLVIIPVILQMNIDLQLKINLMRRIGYPILKVLSKLICSGRFDISNFIGIALSNKTVLKEVSKRPYMYLQIMKYIRNRYQEIFNSFPGGEQVIQELISLILNDCNKMEYINEKLSQLDFFLMDIMSLPVDIYCLMRVFKKHNIEASFQPEESTNIIIYAGEWHIQNYMSFLKSVGAVEIYKYRDVDMTSYNYRSCIKMIPVLPKTDAKLIRFNSSLEALTKTLIDKKWNGEITSIQDFDYIYSIVQDGNERADQLFLLTKKNQLSTDDFIKELEKLRLEIYEQFTIAIENVTLPQDLPPLEQFTDDDEVKTQ